MPRCGAVNYCNYFAWSKAVECVQAEATGASVFTRQDSMGLGVVEATKGYRESTHRLVPPEKTLQWVLPFVQVMGITRIANVTGLDSIGIPVVMVCRPNSRSVSVAQGKGFDLTTAKVSGLMESVESLHAERVSHPLKLCSLEDLRYTQAVVDVDRLPRLSDSKFTPFERILWVEGDDLLGDRPRWVPYEMVHLDYTLPLPSGHGCFQASSNGLASGNHFLEATTHAICELIEPPCAIGNTALSMTLAYSSVDRMSPPRGPRNAL